MAGPSIPRSGRAAKPAARLVTNFLIEALKPD
jgi:hypothetical protein